MDKHLVSHVVVAVIAVGLAYVAWLNPKPTEGNSVVLLPGSPKRLHSISFKDEQHHIVASRDGAYIDVSIQKVRPKPSPSLDAKKQAEDAKEAQLSSQEPGENALTQENASLAPEPVEIYPAAKHGQLLFEQLMPFEAVRSVGVVAKDRQKLLGLNPPKRTLTFVYDNEKHEFFVGNQTYGVEDFYAKKPDSDEVFLLATSPLRNMLNGGPLLLDKSAVGYDRDTIVRLKVIGKGKTREFVQRHPEDKKGHFLASPDDLGTKLEKASSWFQTLFQIRVLKLVDAPPADAPAFEIEFFSDKEKMGTFKLWHPGEAQAFGASTRWHQAFTVPKTFVRPIIDDLEAVLKEGL